jgi:uncharacterized protein YbaP (TraB family)
MDRRGFLGDRQLLTSRVSPVTSQKLKALARRRPALAPTLAMEPWLAAFTIVQDGYARAGLDFEHSLETFIQKLAIQDRKPMGALERPRDQILAMADAPLWAQEDFLQDALAKSDSPDFCTDRLRQAWVEGNEERLRTALGLASTQLRSGLHERIISERNRRWRAKIESVMARGRDSLIVVGVEHLVADPNALPALLEQSGLFVRKLN